MGIAAYILNMHYYSNSYINRTVLACLIIRRFGSPVTGQVFARKGKSDPETRRVWFNRVGLTVQTSVVNSSILNCSWRRCLTLVVIPSRFNTRKRETAVKRLDKGAHRGILGVRRAHGRARDQRQRAPDTRRDRRISTRIGLFENSFCQTIYLDVQAMPGK